MFRTNNWPGDPFL